MWEGGGIQHGYWKNASVYVTHVGGLMIPVLGDFVSSLVSHRLTPTHNLWSNDVGLKPNCWHPGSLPGGILALEFHDL